MADNTIDTLDLQVRSSTAKAVRSLENLSRKLLNVNSSFKNLNTGGLHHYAREIGRVSASIKTLNGVRVSLPNLGGLTKQLTNISRVNFSALDGSGKSLKDFASGLLSISGLQNISVPKIDTKNINSVTKAIEKLGKVDSSNAQQTINSIQKVAHSMSVLNTVDFSGSKVIQGINAVKRLMEVKTDNFDTTTLDKIANSMKSFSDLPDVSSSTNRFVSSLQKLVNAGDKAKQVEVALPGLGKQLKSVIKTLSRVGDVSEPTNLFVQSIGRLASAGNKTSQTAGQLQTLAQETKKFFKVMENAPKISENTIRMTEALAQLASAGGKVNTATNSISSAFSKLSSGTLSLGNLVIKTASKIGSGIKTIIGWFQRLGNGSSGLKTASFNLGALFKTAVGFKAIQGIIDFGRSAVNLGSQITEVENVVDVAFGSMSDKAYQFASTAKEQFGLSELAAKQYSGTMMAMMKSSGVAQDAASKMSISLAGLAGDIASFYNIDTDTAFQKIRSGISGEIEPLRQLGINLSVANMEAYALSRGITTSYNAMSQAEKVALRYNYLMSVTGDVQGDFVRTSGTWANQVRLLTLNFQSLSAVIGQGVIAGILPAIQAINALMSKLMQAANVFRNFMYVLMGKKLKGSQTGVSDVVSDLGGIETAVDDASSGLDDATSSAKKLKKALSVLPFDQLNQLADNSNDSGTASKSLGSGLGDLADSFAGIQDSLDEVLTVDETPINKWASKIRKAFLAKDWEGVGTTIADMLNLGMSKVYEVINWKNVAPKITEFTDAFTRAFNSLNTRLDFDLLGRTIGTGINTAVNTLNQLIGDGGIDFGLIGRNIGDGLIGALDEINWTNLGELLGNKFMISWKMLSGFVKRMSEEDGAGVTGWDKLGSSLGKALNGAVSKISMKDIADSLSGILNGAFRSLAAFTKTVNWDELTNNITEGISTFLKKTNWKENGQALGDFISHLCTALKNTLTKDTFYEFGQGVGTFLGELPWGEILSTAAELILGGLSSAFNGLVDGLKEDHPLVGSLVDILGKAFLAVNVLKVSGIGELAWNLIDHISEKIIAKENAKMIAEKLADVLGDGTSGAKEAIKDLGDAAGSSSSKFGSLAKALGPLVGEAGLIVAVGAAATVATSQLAGLVETMQGGNGVGTTFGNTMNNFIQTLQRRGDILSGSAEEIWQLKESLEQEGMTAEDKAKATQQLIDKLGEMGVTSDQAEQAFSQLNQKGLITDDMFKILSDSIKTLDDKTTNMAGSIDLSKQSIDDLYDTVLPQLQTQLGLSADEMVSLDTALMEAENSGGTAQDAFDNIMARAKELGINTESVAKIFAQVFPDAVKEMETKTKTSISSANTFVKTGMGSISKATGTAMSGIQTATEKAMSAAQTKVKTATDNISSDSETNWGNSASAVSTALGTMDTDTKDVMGKVMTTIQSYWSSVLINTNQIWEKASGKVDTETGKMLTYAENNMSSVARVFSSIRRTIDGNFSGLYSVGKNAMNDFKRGIESVYIRTPHIEMNYTDWQEGNTHKYRWNSNVKWFAKGGLFNGAQVIGVGEAGSEAVLPLENPRTMKKIADSIVSSSDGSMGLTKEEMAKAVAQGVAMAMSMNSGNKNPQYIMNSIILDGSEIAKAVSKAQKDTNSRFNPSPAY
nr:MAG TPA: minor tail protein [Caudoviricetes sp.]DAV70072.1 MAG TPA: minor tail protein [Caudoviricetes sp.]